MALADLVLEGLTLALVIALGLVLIGGLAYLTVTVTSVNNARLAYAGLYVYLPQPFYVNGTLYVPMLNIGYYRALVKYVYVRSVDGSVHVYAPGLVLGLGQYYVYRLSPGYEPVAVTVVASPVGYPGVVREFSANVTGVSAVPVVTLSGPGTGGGLIEVIVNDPYGAGWQIQWSYAGQTYSMGQSQSYTWYINPPYAPIQIIFTAKITQNPSANGINYTCSITPSQVSNSYGPGSVVTFNVQCSAEYYVVVQLYAPCHNANYWVTAWTDTQSVSVNGYQGSGTYTLYYTTTNPQGIGQVAFQACESPPAFIEGKLAIYNLSAPGNPMIEETNNWSSPLPLTWCTPILTIDTAPGITYAGVFGTYGGCAVPGPFGGGGNNGGNNSNQISVSVSDSYGAGWSVTWSGGASGGKTGSGSTTWNITASSTVNFNAKITSNPANYTCTINPTSTSANPGDSVTFTVTCTSTNTTQPPPSGPYCIVTPQASDNVGGASGIKDSPGTTQYLSPGQSQTFYWWIQYNPVTYDGTEYYLNNMEVSLNGQVVANQQTSSIDYTFTCPGTLTSNQTYTLTGTANYMPRYLKYEGGNTISAQNGTLGQIASGSFSWSDPIFLGGSWSISYSQYGTSLKVSVTLNDQYSETGQATPLSESQTLAISNPPGYLCSIYSVSATSGSISSGQASNWMPPVTVTITCTPIGNGGK